MANRKRFWFWLHPSDPLAAALEQLGPDRNAVLVTVLRAALCPGGLTDVLERLDRLEQRLNSLAAAPPAAQTDAPTASPTLRKDDAARAHAFLAAFGGLDD